MKIKILIKYSKWVWTIVVISAVGYYSFTRWERIGHYFQAISLIKICMSVLFIFIAKSLLVLVSKYSLDKEDLHLQYADVFSMVSITQLGKYIPGGIWHFVGRYSAYNEKNISAKKTTKALVNENVWLVSGALLTGVLIGGLTKQWQSLLGDFGIQIPFLGIAIGVLLLWIVILYVYESLFPSDASVNYLFLILVLLFAWISFGISFGLMLPDFSSETILFYIATYAISWLAGYLAFFAPGGIGIRETALIWMLGGFVSPELALIYSSAHRFIMILVEIIMGGFSLLIGYFYRIRTGSDK